jgi:hypothetical protein
VPGPQDAHLAEIVRQVQEVIATRRKNLPTFFKLRNETQ